MTPDVLWLDFPLDQDAHPGKGVLHLRRSEVRGYIAQANGNVDIYAFDLWYSTLVTEVDLNHSLFVCN